MINGRLLYDAFPFFEETELLKVRRDYLAPLVDTFVTVEATTDHSNRPHTPILHDGAGNIREEWDGVSGLAPWLTVLPEGESNWPRVWAHRNAILDALNYYAVPGDALVLLSDIDEIPHRDALIEAAGYFTRGELGPCSVVRFKHLNFYYDTQTISPNLWDGSVLTTAHMLRLRSPQAVRYQTADVTMDGAAGWHFSYFGGTERIVTKMKAIAESPWTGQDGFTDRERVEKVIASGADLYGRDGETWIRLPKPPEGLPAGMEQFAVKESYANRYEVKTEHPVASDSLDHLYPVGATRDNTHCAAFARKMAEREGFPTLSALDIGCAGGGLVADYHAAGLLAIGIEGSDKPANEGHGHWPALGGSYLFTADATKPFRAHSNGSPIRFSFITSFEVLEHIAEADLPQFMHNIRHHLSPDGRFICTINSDPWPHVTEDGQTVDHHVTRRSPEWWERILRGFGFERDRELEAYIGQDWPRVGHAHFALKVVDGIGKRDEEAETPAEASTRPVQATETPARRQDVVSSPAPVPSAAPSSITPTNTVPMPWMDVQIVHHGDAKMLNQCVHSFNDSGVTPAWVHIWLNGVSGGLLDATGKLNYLDAHGYDDLYETAHPIRRIKFNYEAWADYKPSPNNGFIEPNNTLYKKGDAPYVLLLNTDVELRPGWDVVLLAAMCLDDNLGAVGFSGGLLTEDARCAGAGVVGRDVDYIEGWCLLLRRSAVDAVGGLFDTDMDFAYCEDTDLCLRLKAAGFGICALPNPENRFALHYGSQTTNKVIDENGADRQRLLESFAHNTEILKRKHGPYLKHGRVLTRQ